MSKNDSPFRLILMRHGEAGFASGFNGERALTERGRLEAENVGKQLRTLNISPDLIWVSSLLRAQQTLELLDLSAPVQVRDSITPSGNVTGVARSIHQLEGGVSSLMLVSHMPIIGELAGFLTNGNLYHSMPFSTAQLLVLEASVPAEGCYEIVKNIYPSL